MAITHTVNHPFVSLKADGSDSSLVQPTDWNADHTIVHNCAGEVLLGRAAGSAGPVQEVTLGDGLEMSGGALSLAGGGALPVGAIIDFGGSSAPTGWLFCNGVQVSRTTYAELFTVIGELFGAGDGVSTFNVPDLRGRATFGRGAMGGVDAARITTGGSGIDGATQGASGGAETHTLVVEEIPEHRHTIAAAGAHIHFVVADGSTSDAVDIAANESIVRASTAGGYALDAVSSPAPTLAETSEVADHTHGSALVGEDEAHNNMPPALIVTKIIFAGVSP